MTYRFWRWWALASLLPTPRIMSAEPVIWSRVPKGATGSSVNWPTCCSKNEIPELLRYVPRGEVHIKCSALTWLARSGNMSSVILDNPSAQRQADSCAWVLVGAVKATEDVVYLWRILLFKPDSVVGETDSHILRLSEVFG